MTTKPERRIVPSIAVLVSMALPLLLPGNFVSPLAWLLPAVEGIFFIVLIAVDPGRIDRRGRQVRVLSIGFVVVIAGSAGWAGARLVVTLFQGATETATAGELLVAGALVWIDLVIAFAFVYWELDSGGPAERWFSPPVHPHLAFPQHMNRELAPPGWRPLFLDYLYLSLTNGLAFSPTDVMPLARWAKVTMGIQSLVSIVIFSLVIANSVNLLG